jgi:hypothetical protein
MPPDAEAPAPAARTSVFAPRGTASKSMRHFGQVPRERSRMSGCIGQTYATDRRFARPRARVRCRATRPPVDVVLTVMLTVASRRRFGRRGE